MSNLEARTNRSRRMGRGLLLLAAGLALGLIAFAWSWTPPAPLSARLVQGPDSPMLQLECGNCPDGSRVSEGENSAEFSGQSASLRVAGALHLGGNDLVVHLERPGLGRDEDVSVYVPVPVQVQRDVSELDKGHLGISIEAVPDARITVDGNPLELTQGKASLLLDFTEQLASEERTPSSLEHTFQVTATIGERTETLAFAVTAPIIPLQIEAPRSFIVVDSEQFMLAGRTVPGAQVTVADTPIAVDAAGNFAQLMSIDAEGQSQFEIRAQTAGWAPRTRIVHIERVRDRRRAARAFAGRSLNTYAQLITGLSSPEHPDVALMGRVHEARTARFSTTVLLEVSAGCDVAPCLVRVVHGAPLELTPNRHLAVFGRLVGPADVPFRGVPLPEVEAFFVLP